jgi:DNA mismatch endonuclease (patch repair protein)
MAPTSTPSFKGLRAASQVASDVARASSRKRDTRCELVLRRALWSCGLRYRLHCGHLPGCPDVVFLGARVVVFCDGDFWHGRNLEARLRRLKRGHNASYWVAKVRRNSERDRENTAALETEGWKVVRLWESDILKSPETQVAIVRSALEARVRHPRRRRSVPTQ